MIDYNKIDKLATTLAFANLLILFPLSIVYYFYIAKGIITPLPYKLHRTIPLAISIILALILFINIFIHNRFHFQEKTLILLGLFCLLSIFIITILGLSRLNIKVDANGQNIKSFELTAVANSFMYFLTGLFLLQEIYKFKKLTLFIFFILCLFLLFNINKQNISLSLPSDNTSYLFIGDAFAIFALFALSFSATPWTILIFFISPIISFTLISRAAFATLIITVLLCLTQKFTYRQVIYVSVSILFLITMIVIFPNLRNSQIFRGYGSTDINSPDQWKSYGDKVVIESPIINEKNGIKIKNSSPHISTYFVFPAGFDAKQIQWEMTDEFPIMVRFLVKTEKGGAKVLHYILKKIPIGTKSQVSTYITKKDNIKNLFIVLPYYENEKKILFQRDISSDIKYFPEEGDFQFIKQIYINGNATLMNIKISNEKNETALSRFYSYHFGQFKTRTILINKQIEALKKNWLWGDFCGQLKFFDGSLGNYMHNWLSFWMQYGLIPFLLFCGLFFYQYFIIGKEFFQNGIKNFIIEFRKFRAYLKYGYKKNRNKYYETLKEDNPLLVCTFLLATFNLIEVIFARSYATPYIWLSMGMMPSYLYLKKNNFQLT